MCDALAWHEKASFPSFMMTLWGHFFHTTLTFHLKISMGTKTLLQEYLCSIVTSKICQDFNDAEDVKCWWGFLTEDVLLRGKDIFISKKCFEVIFLLFLMIIIFFGKDHTQIYKFIHSIIAYYVAYKIIILPIHHDISFIPNFIKMLLTIFCGSSFKKKM